MIHPSLKTFAIINGMVTAKFTIVLQNFREDSLQAVARKGGYLLDSMMRPILAKIKFPEMKTETLWKMKSSGGILQRRAPANWWTR